MELLRLDNNTLEPRWILENYKSLIWTERYFELGEFKLVYEKPMFYQMPPGEGPAAYQPPSIGEYLACTESPAIMKIESVDATQQENGTFQWTLSGRSVEAILEQRTTMLASNPQKEYWTRTGSAGGNASVLINSIVSQGLGYGGAADNITELDTPVQSGGPNVTSKVKQGSLYTRVREILTPYGLGFFIRRNATTKKLQLEIYNGLDRTSTQSSRPVVAFNVEAGDFAESTYLRSIKEDKATAYVRGRTMSRIIGSPDSGLTRKVVYVDASDVQPDDGDEFTILGERGQAAIDAAIEVQMFDGKLQPNNQFVYERDYKLGDIVQIDSYVHGYHAKARVIERILSADVNGVRTYPTFKTTQQLN